MPPRPEIAASDALLSAYQPNDLTLRSVVHLKPLKIDRRSISRRTSSCEPIICSPIRWLVAM
jgi:hypothetical protein